MIEGSDIFVFMIFVMNTILKITTSIDTSNLPSL